MLVDPKGASPRLSTLGLQYANPLGLKTLNGFNSAQTHSAFLTTRTA